MLLFVCLFVSFTKKDKIRHSSMNYVSWRLQSIPSLVHSIKSPRRNYYFFIIITVEPRLLELWEETKNNSS